MAAALPIRVGPKFQVTIPQSVRRAVGLKAGDWIEAKAERDGSIRLKRKRLMDHHAELAAALEEAEADIKAGRVSKPYRSARALVRSLKQGERNARKMD